jgi:hypothetical protein
MEEKKRVVWCSSMQELKDWGGGKGGRAAHVRVRMYSHAHLRLSSDKG